MNRRIGQSEVQESAQMTLDCLTLNMMDEMLTDFTGQLKSQHLISSTNPFNAKDLYKCVAKQFAFSLPHNFARFQILEMNVIDIVELFTDEFDGLPGDLDLLNFARTVVFDLINTFKGR
jgi:hypothetical protein